MTRLKRAWQLFRLSWRVTRANPALLRWVPLLWLATTAIALAALYVGLFGVCVYADNPGLLVPLLAFFGPLTLALIYNLFQTGVVYMAKARFEGGSATARGTAWFVLRSFHRIAAWTVVDGSVGLVMRGCRKTLASFGRSAEVLGEVATSVVEVAWGAGTLFAIPVIVDRRCGPKAAIAESLRLVRQTWVESLAGGVGFGALYVAVAVAVALLVVPIAMILPEGGTASQVLGIVVIVGIALGAFVVGVVRMVYLTALYVQASAGRNPTGIDLSPPR